jgi:hypothetical protein
MKIVKILLCLIFLSGESSNAQNSPGTPLRSACQNSDKSSVKTLAEVICLERKAYQLNYDQKLRIVVLSFGHKRMSLERYSKGRDPALVGADKIIGFLPEKLQVYKRKNLLLYVSAIRTNSGAGSGQCGAGSEIYLNFLSVEKSVPRVSSKILIGSCDYSIELDNQSIPDGEVGEISAKKEKLVMHFLNYKDMNGSPRATVAPGHRKLAFNE